MNKKQLNQVILQGLVLLVIPVTVITIEIIDMEREFYDKAARYPSYLKL